MHDPVYYALVGFYVGVGLTVLAYQWSLAMTHTPGPWTAWHNGDDDDDSYEVGATADGFSQAFATVEGEDNARLVAAAPRLLEAAQRIRAALLEVKLLDRHLFAYHELKEAIAQATGADN